MAAQLLRSRGRYGCAVVLGADQVVDIDPQRAVIRVGDHQGEDQTDRRRHLPLAVPVDRAEKMDERIMGHVVHIGFVGPISERGIAVVERPDEGLIALYAVDIDEVSAKGKLLHFGEGAMVHPAVLQPAQEALGIRRVEDGGGAAAGQQQADEQKLDAMHGFSLIMSLRGAVLQATKQSRLTCKQLAGKARDCRAAEEQERRLAMTYYSGATK